MHWLENTPIWIIGLAVLATLSLAHEAGFQSRRLAPKDDDDGGKGYLVSSMLALLGLLMAFTFSAAQDRFAQRQQLVVEEANALSTAYLRVQTLGEPWRTELSRELMPYVELRAGYFAASEDRSRLDDNERQTAAQRARVWERVATAVQANPVPTLNGSLLDAINRMFDIAAARTAVAEARVPISILRVLAIFMLSAAAIMGFASAPGRRYGVVSTAVLALVTVAYCLILDLDRPSAGSVRVNQTAMVYAVEDIQAMESGKPRRPDFPTASTGVAGSPP